MYNYQAEQKTLEIGSVKIGGTPGLMPTVMVGSVFHSKDRLVKDAKSGDVDKASTEALLNQLADISERTGLPSVLDVVASTLGAMEKYLRYLVDVTDMPLLIDGSGSAEVNIAGLEVAKDAGILDRVALNSITPDSDEAIYSKIEEVGLRNAIILTFSNAAMTSATKRAELAEELYAKAKSVGADNVMFDTGVVDLPTLGLACRAFMMIKDKFGLPVGCGAHNAVAMWKGLVPKFGKRAKIPAFVGSNLMPVALGADFVLYGPIRQAPVVFPSVAMIDVALSGSLIEERIRPERPHPRYLVG